MTTKELANELKNYINSDFLELVDVEDCLDYLGVTPEDLDYYKQTENDFWNDKDKDGQYWCDLSSSYADASVNIYYADLYANAGDFAQYTNEAIEELGLAKDTTLDKILALGEYYFYQQFANQVLMALKNYALPTVSN